MGAETCSIEDVVLELRCFGLKGADLLSRVYDHTP